MRHQCRHVKRQLGMTLEFEKGFWHTDIDLGVFRKTQSFSCVSPLLSSTATLRTLLTLEAGGFSPNKQFSATPAVGRTTEPNSATVYLDIASEPTS